MSIIPGSNESHKSVFSESSDSVFGSGPASVLGSGFLTVGEFASITQVSPADSSFVDQRLSSLLQKYKEVFAAMPRMNGGDSIVSYLEEAEKVVTAGLPTDVSAVRKNALIARTFFSFLRQDLRVPHLSTQTNKLLETVDIDECLQFINMTGLAPTDPVACAKTREDLQRVIALYTTNINEVPNGFADENVKAILTSVVSGTYTRATRQQIELVYTRDNIEQLAINAFDGNMSETQAYLREFPLALIESREVLGDHTFSIAGGSVLHIYLNKQFLNRSISHLEIVELPHSTPAEIRTKAERLHNRLNNSPFADLRRPHLYLSGKGLKTTIPRLSLFTNLTSINLSDNQFHTVPLLPVSLTNLDLSGNPLTRFSHLTNLSKLTGLELNNVGLKRIPKEVFSLPNLAFLSVKGNQLITLSDEVVYINTITFDGNSIVYASPSVAAHLEHMGYHTEARNLRYELLYSAVSPLGKLYQQFVKPESEYNLDEIKLSLAAVSEDDRNLIYEMVWKESGKPETSDGSWGEHHAFDDLNVIARAVRSAILTKRERLSYEQYDQTRKRIYNLANCSTFTQRGEIAFDDHEGKHVLSRLADAMSFETPDTPSESRESFDLQLNFLAETGIFLKDLLRTNKYVEQLASSSAPNAEVRAVEMKISLKDKWDGFYLETKPAFEARLAENAALYPEVTASTVMQIPANAPEYLFRSKELLLVELEEAYRRIRTIQPEDYTGTNFQVEKEYDAQAPLARLFKLFVQDFFSVEKFEARMGQLPEEDRNLIYLQIWISSESRDATLVDDEDKIDWGREHALDDVRTLGLSVQAAIYAKFNALSQEQLNRVYGKVYRLAELPATEGFEPWGEIHALDSLSRLADAMHSAQIPLVNAMNIIGALEGIEAFFALFFNQQGNAVWEQAFN